ncbi:MAG TPA: phosphoribosylformylglycinamidine synthase subunit PurQ [Pirellulales bacterium]|jgi:phosphoribosylformylglycinamidine synthase|nr:phosphoribosylformylglycinamidine synthase subunit PurQ [Pirellulales bacterium]
MPQPRILVLRAPGTNCDAETLFAFEQAGGRAEALHINRLLESPGQLADYQVLCLPGGFSYGDDLAAGRILANQLRHHLADWVETFKSAGKLILGICNGFQILIKAGILLPDDPGGAPSATLTWNDSGKFEDRWVPLFTSGSKSVFFAGIDALYLPVAHAEGKFVPCSTRVLQDLDAGGQLVLRYGSRPEVSSAACAAPRAAYPDNPNGSQADVAGVCDATGRVCGLMPHPERCLSATQHPRWTRQPLPPEGTGLRVFQNAVNYFR